MSSPFTSGLYTKDPPIKNCKCGTPTKHRNGLFAECAPCFLTRTTPCEIDPAFAKKVKARDFVYKSGAKCPAQVEIDAVIEWIDLRNEHGCQRASEIVGYSLGKLRRTAEICGIEIPAM